MTQADLAARIAWSALRWSGLSPESGRFPSTELVTIAGALDRPVDWFFGSLRYRLSVDDRDPAVGGSPVHSTAPWS